MSFESDLAKRKKRKGVGIVIAGIIIFGLFTYPIFVILLTSSKCIIIPGIFTDCQFYIGLALIGFFLGLTLIVIGVNFITQKNKLSISERRIKNEIDKDKKIKELEKRLEKIEDSETKSKNDSSSEEKPENS